MSLLSICVLILTHQIVNIQCNICPDLKPAANFNLEKFATGTWYDVAIPRNNLTNGDIFASLAYMKDGKKITFKTAGIPEDDINYVEGFAEELSFGKLLYTYIVGEPKEHVHTKVTIAAIDDDFVALYGCKNNDDTQEIVWVASRVEKPEGALKEKIQNYLDNFISPVTHQHVSWMTRL